MASLNKMRLDNISNIYKDPFGIKCQLCEMKRSKFYCQTCVKNGVFTDSSQPRFSESFAEKNMKLMLERRKKSSVGVEEKLRKILEVESLKQGICAKKERIDLLKKSIREKQSYCRERAIYINSLSKKASDSKKHNARLCRGVSGKKLKLNFISERVSRRIVLLDKVLFDLSNEMASDVNLLVKYIFQIERNSRCEESSSKSTDFNSTVCQLSDATQTAYISGKWVQIKDEESLKIVESELPSSGDYSACVDWIMTYGNSEANSECGFNNSYHRISSALTYAAQMLSVLSFLFNIRLPHRLCYSEFCMGELNDVKFSYKVAKLNANIMYLCLAQGIDKDLVNPRQTLANVSILFNEKYCRFRETKDLCQESSMVDVTEDQIIAELNSQETEEDSDDERTLSADTCNPEISPDWETVPQSLPNDEVNCSQVFNQDTTNDHGITGSIVSSAAATVISFWKGYTGHK